METFETFINTPVISGEFDDSHYSQNEDRQCINNHLLMIGLVTLTVISQMSSCQRFTTRM